MDEKRKCNIIVANSLKKIRLFKGLTQKDVANAIGITTRCYCYYETGKREIPLYVIFRLSKYYKMTIDNIVNNRIK